MTTLSPPDGQPRKTRRVQNGDRTPPPQAPPAAFRPGPGVQQGKIAGPPVVASLEALAAEFEALVASNQAKFTELGAQGTAPDPLYLVHARINSLIDSIAQFAGPNGPRWAMMARLTFERQIAAELEQAAPAVRRMQLAEGARYTPAMIRALAAQAGLAVARAQ